MNTESQGGFTTRDVARRYRVSEDKVRAWIQSRELIAINTAGKLCGKPRWVVTAESLADFEKRRTGGQPQTQENRRRRTVGHDFYPD